MELFKSFWDIMGKDIKQFIEESKENDNILQAFNSMFIVTIPKENNMMHFK
jgi:hypothetical protein